MDSIIESNYAATRARGLITRETDIEDFFTKLDEETRELHLANSSVNFNEELADVILVCLNIAKHYGIDIETELINKVSKNIGRIND